MPLADWPLVTTGVTSTVDAHGLSPTEVLTAPPVDLTPHRVDLTQHRVEPHIDTRGPDPASRGTSHGFAKNVSNSAGTSQTSQRDLT